MMKCVPGDEKDHIIGRDSQFSKIEANQWGRIITFNMRLPFEQKPGGDDNDACPIIGNNVQDNTQMSLTMNG